MKVKDIIGKRVKCVKNSGCYVRSPYVGEMGTVTEKQIHPNSLVAHCPSVRIEFDNGRIDYWRIDDFKLVDDHLENISKKYTI